MQRKKPLSLPARLKAKFNNIFIRFKDLQYITANNLLYRNNLLKINAKQYNYKLISFHSQTRPLNKITFYNLFLNMKKFSFKAPIFVSYKFWRKTSFKVLYVGFPINIKMRKKARRKNILNNISKKYKYLKYKKLSFTFRLIKNIKYKKNNYKFKKIIAFFRSKKRFHIRHKIRDIICYKTLFAVMLFKNKNNLHFFLLAMIYVIGANKVLVNHNNRIIF